MKLYLPLTEISVHGASRALPPLFLRLLLNQTGTLQFQLVLCSSLRKFIFHQEVSLAVLPPRGPCGICCTISEAAVAPLHAWVAVCLMVGEK